MEHRSIREWLTHVIELFGARPQALQIAALACRMREGKLEVCMVTSRGKQRWIIPKGWPEANLTNAKAAAREAWEEAGLIGATESQVYGSYQAKKNLDEDITVPVRIDVYLMLDPNQEAAFPEKGQRKIKWMPVREAAACASDVGLAELLYRLDAEGLPDQRPR